MHSPHPFDCCFAYWELCCGQAWLAFDEVGGICSNKKSNIFYFKECAIVAEKKIGDGEIEVVAATQTDYGAHAVQDEAMAGPIYWQERGHDGCS